MREHRQEHTIARMAKVLGVSESGYFKWCKKNNAPLTEKEQEDIKITEEMRSTVLHEALMDPEKSLQF